VLRLPNACVVVLVGPAASGKSTWAATAASARRRPIEAATSPGVTPAGYWRVEPSGSL